MIKFLISGVFKIVISLVSVILAPIDALIGQFIPDLSNALDYVSKFFDYIGNVGPFVLSYLGINEIVLNVFVDVMFFILSVPFMVNTIKLALAWYNKLKI